MMSPAGTKIPESSPSSNGNRCGTDASGWVKGSHPTQVGVEVTRKVCFAWDGNNCVDNTHISIMLCDGGYHVYKLANTPTCTLRYCAV